MEKHEIKRLFISQPMIGITDEEFLLERAKAIRKSKEIIDEEVVVLDTFFTKDYGKPLLFVAKRLEVLAQADVAYFVEGWENDRGCRIEHECAKEYNVDRIYPTSNSEVS